MQLLEDRLIASATDVVNFLACEHLTRLDLRAARGELARPVMDDPEAEVLRRRGLQHERRWLAHLAAQGRQVVEVRSIAGSAAERHVQEQEQTLAAMRTGAEVIYQGTFYGEGWLGHADFLLRVDRPSALGAWSYEVADTKLARRVKVGALLQMCAYSEQLAAAQGLEPERMHVVLGDMTVESHRLADYAAYYRAVKDRFLAALSAPEAPTYPDPVDHCRYCAWAACCEQRRRADDHLSLVAGLTRGQARKLAAAGVPTLAALAAGEALDGVKGISKHTLERLSQQARLQALQRQTERVRYELLPPEGADRGLGALPPPSAGDLFFDMEGDPWETDDGLEYLFGVVELAGGDPRYRAFWAHTPAEEKQAFEAFIDYVMARLAEYPDLHVYHYASYEPDRMKRLMGRYGTREDEVDRLLRGGVFVDLLRVVRQSVRVSQESYSLKKLEPLYMDGRDTAIKEGGASIVFYEQWLESHDPAVLREIADYNRDDCVSTWLLRDWLEARRLEAAATFGALPRPSPRRLDAAAEQQEEQARAAGLSGVLLADVPDDPGERSPEQQGRWLLAQLLGWHRREDRPQWWAFFDRLSKSDEELVEDGEALGGLEYEGVVGHEARSSIHRYYFNPDQEHKIVERAQPLDPRSQRGAGTVVALDNGRGIIDLKRADSVILPDVTSLVPQRPLDTRVLRAGLARFAERVAEHGFADGGPYQAGLDLLLRLPPRLGGQAVSLPGESGTETGRRLALALDGGCLAIQGPPGSGKTYTAARMIVDLVRAGRRVGVSANSHKAIGNLLLELRRVCGEGGTSVAILQRASAEDACDPLVDLALSNEDVEEALDAGAVDVVGGTPWLFARPEFEGRFDALFVDEAGQMSLANVLAMSGCARNLVLLGDPQQLPQVVQGTHPPGAERSSLAHVLDGRATIPADMGIFLATTWRMHPEVCAFVSEIAYEGRLSPDPSCALQRIDGGPAAGAVCLLPVEHAGNRTFAPEEVERVAALMDGLLRGSWTNARGERQPLSLDQVLVVAPYNAQVARLTAALPPGARVGTVDKFQGQEAAAVIYSLATSSAEDMPRNHEFLYSLNRLNVAVSRARALVVLVCSPALLAVRCRTPRQMRLANALCRYAEVAARL